MKSTAEAMALPRFGTISPMKKQELLIKRADLITFRKTSQAGRFAFSHA